MGGGFLRYLIVEQVEKSGTDPVGKPWLYLLITQVAAAAELARTKEELKQGFGQAAAEQLLPEGVTPTAPPAVSQTPPTTEAHLEVIIQLGSNADVDVDAVKEALAEKAGVDATRVTEARSLSNGPSYWYLGTSRLDVATAARQA